jgi:hypothetical protein
VNFQGDLMSRTGFAILFIAFVTAGSLFAQSGKEMDSGGPSLSGVPYVVFMNISDARGLKQIRIYVLENASSGTYSYARNRYDGKKSRLEIVSSGSFVITGNEIVFSPVEGTPVKGMKTDRYINVNDEYYLISEEPAVVTSSPNL